MVDEWVGTASGWLGQMNKSGGCVGRNSFAVAGTEYWVGGWADTASQWKGQMNKRVAWLGGDSLKVAETNKQGCWVGGRI